MKIKIFLSISIYLLVCVLFTETVNSQNPIQPKAGVSIPPTPPGTGTQNTGATTDMYHFKIGKLKYGGGGDWYANPTSLPNLISFVNKNTNIKIAPTEDVVDPGSSQLFQYPYVYMTGHGNVKFSDTEVRNLRLYMLSGGFVHIDDNYGMDKYIREEIKKIFPDKPLVEIPYNHPIYHQQYDFASGLPKVHEHDNKPAQGFGIFDKDRLILFYSYECDLGDGWEDANIHKDPEELRQKAFKMGTNLIMYAIGK